MELVSCDVVLQVGGEGEIHQPVFEVAVAPSLAMSVYSWSRQVLDTQDHEFIRWGLVRMSFGSRVQADMHRGR